MFADLIAGPIEFVGKWTFLTIHEPCMSVWALWVIMLSVEYYNKNVVKYVEITDPMKESL